MLSAFIIEVMNSIFIVSSPIATFADNGPIRFKDSTKYIDYSDGLNLNDEFTISFKMKQDKLGNWVGVLSQGYADIKTGGYQVYNHNGDLYFKRMGQDIRMAKLTDTLNEYKIAITYDGNVLRGYINDQLVTEKSQVFSDNLSTNPLAIGGGLGVGPFYGTISELKIYDRSFGSLELFLASIS